MNKAYDKAMQRKTVPIFDPQSTIELIRSGEEIQATLDESGKRQLIDRYFEVSENSFIIHIDELSQTFATFRRRKLLQRKLIRHNWDILGILEI